MASSWEMPQPVFRSSEGETVGARAKAEEPTASEHETLEPAAPVEAVDQKLAALYDPPAASDVPAAEAPAVVSDVAVVEQPYISEQFPADHIATAVPAAAKPGRSGTKVAIGVGLFIAFAAFMLAVGVFLYWFFTWRQTD